MNEHFPKPKLGAVFYQDQFLYAALANHPIAKGHVVVVWKKKVRDLHLLSKKDYEYLMDIIDSVRNAMLQVLKVEKVYLIYMDEVRHVHWHLVPRYNRAGFNLLREDSKELKDFSLAEKFRNHLKKIK